MPFTTNFFQLVRLTALAANQPIDQQQHHGADDRRDESGGLTRLVPANSATQIAGA